jgi:hypothetical protein
LFYITPGMRASALFAAFATVAASPLGGPGRGILSGLQHAALDALARVRVPPPVLGSGHKSAPSRIAFHNPAVNRACAVHALEGEG